MAYLKTHLKKVYRTSPMATGRSDFLRMDMNESISGLPRSFISSVFKKAVPAYLASYPEYSRLVEKIAAHNGLKPENICLSNGSDGAIKYIFDAYVEHDDKVLITDPTFAMYPVYTKMFNAVSVPVKYGPDFKFPYGAFIGHLRKDIKLAVIVNPNNPTGSALESDKILTIIKYADRKGILVIVDEAYFYFYPETVIKEINSFNNLIVLRTFSKLCGIAAMRLGYAAASPEIIEDLRKVKPSYDVNGAGVLFGEAIMDDTDLIHDLTKQVSEGKKYIIEKLSEKGIDCVKGEANFILIDCGPDAQETAKRLSEKNILVAAGFKQDFLKNYIRITVGEKKYMKKFWNSFKDILKGR